jgi:hypothetical protein
LCLCISFLYESGRCLSLTDLVYEVSLSFFVFCDFELEDLVCRDSVIFFLAQFAAGCVMTSGRTSSGASTKANVSGVRNLRLNFH